MSFSADFLMATGALHCGIGLLIPRRRATTIRTLSEMTVDVPDDVDRYQRLSNFWFHVMGILCISHGYLLKQYLKDTGKKFAPKWLGWFLLGFGAVGTTLMPKTPFWGIAGQGVYILWNQKKTTKVYKKE